MTTTGRITTQRRITSNMHAAAIGALALVGLLAAGATGLAAMQAAHEKMDQAKSKAGAPQTQKLAITFKSEPSPPVTGDNKFEVIVKDGMGMAIADADVSVAFHMAAMPAMNMPAMDNQVKLKSEGAGTYRGTGNVMMAGKWDVTVHVKQGAKEIGKKTLAVTAN